MSAPTAMISPFLGRWQKRDLRQPHRPQPRLACLLPPSTSTSSPLRRRTTTALCPPASSPRAIPNDRRSTVAECTTAERRTSTSSPAVADLRAWCSGFVKYGHKVRRLLTPYTTSNVLKGSGTLVLRRVSRSWSVIIINGFYNDGKVENAEIAKIAQYSENVFFGKPSGLMDQTACAVGGFVAIDFKNPKEPVIEKLPFDLAAAGYSLCIVNTGGNHADLNEDYASVPAEMKKVASLFRQERAKRSHPRRDNGEHSEAPRVRGRQSHHARYPLRERERAR